MQNVKQWTADFIVKMIKHMQLIVRPYIYTTDHQNKRGRHINMCRNETFRFLKKKIFTSAHPFCMQCHAKTKCLSLFKVLKFKELDLYVSI